MTTLETAEKPTPLAPSTEDRARLRALRDAGTQGSFENHGGNITANDGAVHLAYVSMRGRDRSDFEQQDADATLIAAAVNALLGLLDALDAADAHAAELTCQRDEALDSRAFWKRYPAAHAQAWTQSLNEQAARGYAVEHPAEACAAVPVDVWRAWLTEHGWAPPNPGDDDPRAWSKPRQTGVLTAAVDGSRCTPCDVRWAANVVAREGLSTGERLASDPDASPGTLVLADLLARAGWTPTEAP